jgi:hypothetical protein
MLADLRGRAHASAMTWLILVALLPRIIMPIGFMPVLDRLPEGLGFQVAICRTVVAADDATPGRMVDGKDLCPFVFVLPWHTTDEPATWPAISATWYPVRRVSSRQRGQPARRVYRAHARDPPIAEG